MAHDMTGTAGALMTAAMIVMMLAMGGSWLAYARRAVPGSWRERIRPAARRSARMPGTPSNEDTR